MEWVGVSVDTDVLSRLLSRWEPLKDELIREVADEYTVEDLAGNRVNVFEGRTFKADRWLAWAERRGIVWPRLDSGAAGVDDDTFRELAPPTPR